MEAIALDSLSPGTVVDRDLYSSKGTLLIAGGSTISRDHLDKLRKLNVFEVYVERKEEKDDLDTLLSRQFEELDELEPEPGNRESSPPDEGAGARERANTDFSPRKRPRKQLTRAVREAPLEELKASPAVLEADKRIREARTPDRPFGKALKETISQPAVGERTEEYKQNVIASYEEALQETKTILNAVSEDKLITIKDIAPVVRQLVALFVTDHNIVLNLAGTRSSGEDYIYHHSLNVCLLSINIAASYGYNERQVEEIGIAALLHDVGMLAVPARIRLHTGRFSREDWYEVQKHPILGLHLLEEITGLPDSAGLVAYQTHERENGKGYPKQRVGRLIHRFAKLVQLADVYEAMSSPRPHREPLVPYRAMENLVKMARQGIVSSEFLTAFLDYTSLFPVGSIVQLSDGRMGKVVAANKSRYAKPVVSILTNSRGRLKARDEVEAVDLLRQRDVQISRALPMVYLQNVGPMDGF